MVNQEQAAVAPGADGLAPASGVLARAPSAGLVVGGIASVQFGSAVASKLFDAVGPGGAGLLRLVTASIVLSVIWRPRVRGLTRSDLISAVAFGVALAAMNVSFYHALRRLPLGAAVTIEFLGPLAVAVAGSRRRVDLVWVGLAAVGILALSHGGVHGLNGVGIMFALIAGAMWACYILLSARVGRAIPGGSGLALAMCVAAVVALPVGVAEGGSQLLSARSLLLGLAVGMLSSAIPYSFELEALRRIAVNVFGVLMSLEPAMAALAGLIVLGQGLSLRSLFGIGLVVLASTGASLGSRRPPTDA